MPSDKYKVSAKAKIGTVLARTRQCLNKFETVELHGLAQASERVTQAASILQHEKEATIEKISVFEHNEEAKQDRQPLTIKTIVTLRKAKK